jgi:SAM-dependent methyltransferase
MRRGQPAPDPRHTGLAIEHNNATGTVTFWQKLFNQSAADRDGISLADYIHAMYGFLRQGKARNVLMIGCGGGTLATMLNHAGVRVTIVDIDARAFEIARHYFHMPDEIECHAADGAAFLRHSGGRYDAIALDAYGDGGIPKHFLAPKFFDLVKSRLAARNALFMINVMVASDEDHTPDGIARAMQKTWRQVRLLDAEGWIDRNAVLVAGSVRDLRRPRLLMPPARHSRRLAGELKELAFRPLRA